MAWTNEQRSAIESRGENLLLSAAAGSGKTTVLVERVVQLLRDGASIDAMLIVTFTRAAASDMRQSLIEHIEAAALQEPALRSQAEAAQTAGISTIHAFCIDILRDHFHSVDVDPAFKVAEGAFAAELLGKALNEAMAEAYAADSPDMQALTVGRRPEQVASLAMELYDVIQNRPHPFEWLNESISRLERGEDVYSPVLVNAVRQRLNDALAYARRAEALVMGRDGFEKYHTVVQSDVKLVSAWMDMDYESLRLSLEKPNFMRLPPVPKLKGDPDADMFKSLRTLMKKQVEAAGKMLSLPLGEALTDLPALAAEVRGLREIVTRLDAAFARLKDERGVLTFGDMEHKALLALEQESVRAALREKYDYIFVDEYQDVSDIQEAIITQIAGENNLFCVGDVKQSIYRFRNAEPGLFQRKYAQYGEGDGGRLILLNRNFRSRENILTFTNAVFAHSMTGGSSEITYDQDAYLIPGPQGEGEGFPIELLLLDKSMEDDQPEEGEEASPADSAIADMKDAEAEALLIARRMADMVGTPIYDGRSKAWRPLRYRDCVVLTRSVKDVAPLMLAVLRREGIPAYADVSGGFLDVVEVRVAVALLRLIDNRRRDLDWIAVLRSPIMGFSSEELSQVRLCAPGQNVPYADAVTAFSQSDAPRAAAVRELMAQLDHWRAVCPAMPLSNFTHDVMQESSLYGAVGALPGGAQRQANLDVLCDRAGRYEDGQSGSLTGFLRSLELMNANREDLGEAHILGENDDVVRIMTVHKSKGLEFPVVFGAMLGRAWRGASGRSELMCHPALGVGMKHIDGELYSRRDTLPLLAATQMAGMESKAEEMRILYVMLTRARERLILTGSVKNAAAALARADIDLDAHLTPTCPLDMILPIALCMPGGEALGVQWRRDEALPAIDAQVISRSSLKQREESEQHKVADLLDEAIAQPVNERLRYAYGWRYPYADDITLPMKLTASGVSHELAGPAVIPDLIERPQFMQQDRSALTGAERGSAVHAALQHLNLARLKGLNAAAMRQEIARQMDDMLARDVLTPAMDQAVDAGLLTAFFLHGQGRRMLAADTLRREWMFTLRLSAREALGVESAQNVLVQGAIDCCFVENGQWVLLDYKTDGTRNESVILDRYAAQVRLYALALERITGVPVGEALICLLRQGTAIPVTTSLPAEEPLFKQII